MNHDEFLNDNEEVDQKDIDKFKTLVGQKDVISIKCINYVRD